MSDCFFDAVVCPIASIVTVEAATISDVCLHLVIPASFGRVRHAHVSFDQHHYLPIAASHSKGNDIIFRAAASLQKVYRAFSAGRAGTMTTRPDHFAPPLVACSLVKLAAPVRTLGETGAVLEPGAPLVACEHELFEMASSVALKAVVCRVAGQRAELGFDRFACSNMWAARAGWRQEVGTMRNTPFGVVGPNPHRVWKPVR